MAIRAVLLLIVIIFWREVAASTSGEVDSAVSEEEIDMENVDEVRTNNQLFNSILGLIIKGQGSSLRKMKSSIMKLVLNTILGLKANKSSLRNVKSSIKKDLVKDEAVAELSTHRAFAGVKG